MYLLDNQELDSRDLATLDFLTCAVDASTPALTTLRDLWRFNVKTLSLPENLNQIWPNPSRLAPELLVGNSRKVRGLKQAPSRICLRSRRRAAHECAAA